MAKTNKVAGFWIKLVARMFDLSIVATFIVGGAFIVMKRSPHGPKHNVIWHFDQPWTFYLWAVYAIIFLLSAFIVLPSLWKGKTIGMFVFRIKITKTKEQPLWKAALKREYLFAVMWTFNVALLMLFINHTLINEYAKTKQSTNFKEWWKELGGWERMRIEVVTTIGTMTLVVQMLFAISSVVRKDKTGFADLIAGTRVVYLNKYTEQKAIKSSDASKSLRPRMIKNLPVDWIK